jgi:hypothetical protein
MISGATAETFISLDLVMFSMIELVLIHADIWLFCWEYGDHGDAEEARRWVNAYERRKNLWIEDAQDTEEV